MRDERIRDVPRSCWCDWHWFKVLKMWYRVIPNPDCPWHRGRMA